MTATYEDYRRELAEAVDLTETVISATTNLLTFLESLRVSVPEVWQDDDTLDLRWEGDKPYTAWTLHVSEKRTIAVYTNLRGEGYGVAVEDYEHLKRLLADTRIAFVIEKANVC